MKRPSLRFGAGVVLAAMLALPVILMPVQAQAANFTVLARDDGFEPRSIQIRPNDSITWTNDGGITHSIDAQGSAPRPTPETLAPRESTQPLTFTTLGTYKYRLDGRDFGSYVLTVTVTNNPQSPSPSPTATGTITITVSPSPKATKSKTATPSPRRTTSSPSPSPSASTATPSPSPSTPTPTPTDPTESASPIPSITGDETGSTSSGNTQAIIAIVGVLVLGALGFLVYRRTLTRP